MITFYSSQANIVNLITVLDDPVLYYKYHKSGNFCCKNIFVVDGSYKK